LRQFQIFLFIEKGRQTTFTFNIETSLPEYKMFHADEVVISKT